MTHDKGTTPTFNNNQALTLNQAHAATGRDRKTLNKRYLEKQYPNAYQQADGRKDGSSRCVTWSRPVTWTPRR